MPIIVNGQPRTDVPANISQLLAQLGLDPNRVAVEYNLNILPRERFDVTLLSDGDQLEIVQFVGGG